MHHRDTVGAGERQTAVGNELLEQDGPAETFSNQNDANLQHWVGSLIR